MGEIKGWSLAVARSETVRPCTYDLFGGVSQNDHARCTNSQAAILKGYLIRITFLRWIERTHLTWCNLDGDLGIYSPTDEAD